MVREDGHPGKSSRSRRNPEWHLFCEIVRACARTFHLTTGTFNLFVKDPTTITPERSGLGSTHRACRSRPSIADCFQRVCVLESSPPHRFVQPIGANLSNLPRSRAHCQAHAADYFAAVALLGSTFCRNPVQSGIRSSARLSRTLCAASCCFSSSGCAHAVSAFADFFSRRGGKGLYQTLKNLVGNPTGSY